MLICNVCLTFIIKRLINGIYKTFLKHSIINCFLYPSFFNLYQTFPIKRLQSPKMFTGKCQIYCMTMMKKENLWKRLRQNEWLEGDHYPD